MTNIKVRGFHFYKDRHGKQRCYHRKTRTPVDLEKYPLGSAEFFAVCDRVKQMSEGKDEPRAGTLGKLISQYRAHSAFLDLKPRTKSDYQAVFDYLKPSQDMPLMIINSPAVARIRDKAAQHRGRRFANYVRSVLSLTFAWGKERGYMDGNPASGVKAIRRPKGAPEANRPWSDSEREAVEAAMPPHMALPIALMMYEGLDPQDAVSLPRSAIKNNELDTNRMKTGVSLWTPLTQPVRSAIRKAPQHNAITLCANKRGKPWTVDGFRASWRKVRINLEMQEKIAPGLTLKGLRHTVATILAEMGCDERTIADKLGQNTIEMARHYSRRADKSQKMAGVVKKFDVELNKRRTKNG